MIVSQRGASIVEVLVALTIFAVGALGTAATLALSLRMSAEGRRAAEAGRLLAGELDRLQNSTRVQGGRCPALPAAALSGLAGTALRWRVIPSPAGMGVEYLLSFPTVRGQHVDTGKGHIACR